MQDHGTGRFTDDLCAINDGYEFFESFKNIYPKKPELKVEYQKPHPNFVDLDITTKKVTLLNLKLVSAIFYQIFIFSSSDRP